MAADYTKPVLGDTYTNWSSEIIANYKALVQGLDPATIDGGGTPAGMFTNARRWNSANKYNEIYNGSTWAKDTTSLAYDITGNAATVTNGVVTTGSYANPGWITSLAWSKITGTPTLLSGYGITDAETSAHAAATYAPLTGTGASGTWGISISGTAALATNVASGSGGQVLYQSAANTTAKLANGSSGNVLTSGGGTAAPGWTAQSALAVGSATTATTATNLAGGGAASDSQLGIYQSGSGATSFYDDFDAIDIGHDFQLSGAMPFQLGGTPGTSGSINYQSDGTIQIQSDGTNSAWLGTAVSAGSTTLATPFTMSKNPIVAFKGRTISGGTSSRWVGLAEGVHFASDPNDGVGFRWGNSGNYFAVVRKGNADKYSNDTGIAISTTTDHVFKIVISASGQQADFFIDGSNVGSFNSSTNMPTAAMGLCAYTETSAGGGPRLYYLRGRQYTR